MKGPQQIFQLPIFFGRCCRTYSVLPAALLCFCIETMSWDNMLQLNKVLVRPHLGVLCAVFVTILWEAFG